MKVPPWLVWYKKPEYRDIKEYSTAVSTEKRALSPDGRNKSAVPSQLSLERVLDNKTCSPMSLYDFYMYLKHIEFSPENLEFYIWFKNYEARCARKTPSIKETSSLSNSTRPASDYDSEAPLDPDTTNETLGQIEILISNASTCTTTCKPTLTARIKALTGAPAPAPSTTADADLRAELAAVKTLFLTPNSAKELNIPPILRANALSALNISTDPEVLRPIADHVYLLLKNCSHRNFVRLGVSNGTYETVCVATGLGIVLNISGFLYVFLRAFVGGLHSRFDAFGAWPMWFLGMTLVLSGLRGSCFFLLLFTRRQPLPWERFDDAASVVSQRKAVIKKLGRLMVFDRKFRVKDGGLREVQHRIVGQSMVGGAIFASLCVLVFIFLPVWRQTA